MKIWVTGAGGFMGVHLVDRLVAQGHEVLATHFRATTNVGDLHNEAHIEICDVRDRVKVDDLLQHFRPDQIFHLAAQSYPTASWTDPRYTIEANVIGTNNIFQALKESGLRCSVLNACSSAQYGLVSQADVPVTEDHALRPLHPYGVSKVAQEMLAYQYFKNFDVRSITVRIFNTTGPRKVNDVCSDLTKRAAEIENGTRRDKRLRVGNLDTRRAIMDVRDCIRAFGLALEKGDVGKTYNVGGNRVYRIQDIVDRLRGLVSTDFEVWQDPDLLRPTDEPIIWGSTARFEAATGWKPTIPLEQTLADMLEYWRHNL